MKNFSISLALVFSSFLGVIHGQTSYFEKRYKEDAEKYIQVLKNEDKSSPIFNTTLERAINNYVGIHGYAPEVIPELFELILESTRHIKKEYYRFLLFNAEYFSESEIEKVKLDLSTMLDKSDYQFYDIVSLYRLHEYKPVIQAEVDSAFFRSLRSSLIPQGTSPHSLSETNTRRFTTLANLGESSIEDSIIAIVNQLYVECENTENIREKATKYSKLFSIVRTTLAKLNSKKSVEHTISLLKYDYSVDELYKNCDDCGFTAFYTTYVTYVLIHKVTRYEWGMIQDGMMKVETGQLSKKEFLDNLYNRIKNSEIAWKKTLIDVD